MGIARTQTLIYHCFQVRQLERHMYVEDVLYRCLTGGVHGMLGWACCGMRWPACDAPTCLFFLYLGMALGWSTMHVIYQARCSRPAPGMGHGSCLAEDHQIATHLHATEVLTFILSYFGPLCVVMGVGNKVKVTGSCNL